MASGRSRGPDARRVMVLHQGFVPAYRKAFFEKLHALRPGRYVIAHGDPLPGVAIRPAEPPFAFDDYRVTNLTLGRLVYQTALRRGLSRDIAGVVLGDEVKYLSSLALAAAAKLTGRKVIYWGFGYHRLSRPATGRFDRLGRASAIALKRGLARFSDGYLAYTQSGADALIAQGCPPAKVAVLRNTIDLEPQFALAAQMARKTPLEARRALGLDRETMVALYVGRLIADKKVADLVRSVDLLVERGLDVTLVVVGDGPERAALEAMASGKKHVRFEGGLGQEDPRLAMWFKLAFALAIPGFVGLAVNHAFAHGAPVITRAHPYHSPEVDYIEHGENGLIVEGGLDAYADALERVATDRAFAQKLERGALQSARELDMSEMAARFDAAVGRFVGLEAG